MVNIIKGNLLADDWGDGMLEKVGEYWTSMNDYYIICIQYMGKLITMEKAEFQDWLQIHNLLYDELIAKEVWGSRFDPYDIGMDVE